MDSITLGYVVASYPEGPAVDVLLPDDGRRLRGVQVAVPTGTDSTGTLDLPDVGGPVDDTRWNINTARERNMRALIEFYRGVPIVVGFLLPSENQITFKEKNRRIMRHASDVYTSIDDAGNLEVFHPSGTYLRIGEASAHEDLTGKDFDKKWKIVRNTNKAVHVHLSVKNAGVEKASLNIDPSGNVALTNTGNTSVATTGNLAMTAGGNITMAAGGNVAITGTRIDLN